MAVGKPAIPTLRTVDLREVQGAVNAIRERLRVIDAEVTVLQSNGQGFTNAKAIAILQAQMSLLTTALGGTALAALQVLMAGGDGIVVHSGTSLIVRSLEAGDNVTITFPDGVDGNPVISSAGGDSVLYDGEGRAMLTGDGHAILV
jgi:hypothetical protein